MNNVLFERLNRAHVLHLAFPLFIWACSGNEQSVQQEPAVTLHEPVAARSEPQPPGTPAPEEQEDDAGGAPELPMFLHRFCPFEYGCGFRRPWLVTDTLPVYVRLGDTTHINSYVLPETCVTPVRGVAMVSEPAAAVLDEAFEQSFYRYEAGDTLYILAYGSEGSVYVWHDGRTSIFQRFWGYEGAPAHLLREPVYTWWVELEGSDPSWLRFGQEPGIWGPPRIVIRGVEVGSVERERLEPPVACRANTIDLGQ